jgi:transposase
MKHFLGIDVSKQHLDLALVDQAGALLSSERTANEGKQVTKLFRRWIKEYALQKSTVLVCLEPTGHYSYGILQVLVQEELPTWLARPLDIKHSIGATRGKNDQIDAQRIAHYARRFHDKADLIGPRTLQMNKLKQLLTCRRQLVADKRRHQVRMKDLNRSVDKSLRSTFDRFSSERLRQIAAQLQEVEKLIEQHIQRDPVLQQQYELLLSVNGVGPVLAAYLLATTEGFTRFGSARQLACQAGVVPYEHTSGSSIRGRRCVSHQADHTLKTLLHMSALGAIQRAGELREYYLRKVQEGKAKMAVINAVRCKILHRLFAVIKRGTPYQHNYQHPLAHAIE